MSSHVVQCYYRRACSPEARCDNRQEVLPISLFPVYCIGFLFFASMTLLYPVMPPYAASFGASVPQVGLVVALHPAVGTFFQVPTGLLSDRLGRRLLLSIGLIGTLLSSLLYLFVPNLGALMALRVFNGVASSAFYPAAAALVVDLAPPEKRGQAIGMFTTATQLGNMAGPAIGGLVLQHLGFPAAFLTGAAFSAIALLIALAGLKSVRPGGGAFASGDITLKWIGNWAVIAGPLSTLFVMVGIASLTSFLPLYGVQLGIDIGKVGLILATVFLGSAVMRIVAGRTCDMVGRAPVMLAGLAMCGGSTFLVSIFTTEVPLHAAALIYGLGMGSTLPAAAALIADLAPARMRGFAMGFNSGSYNAGLALGGSLLGFVADWAGFARMYLVTAAVMGLAMVLIFAMTGKAESRKARV